MIVQNFEDKIQKNPQFKHVTVCWFGGEPLIGLSSITRLAPQLMDIAATYGVKYTSRLVTNGLLLTPECFQQLIDYKVNFFEITIDGTKEYHDITRVKKVGSGSFDAIFKNVKNVVAYKNTHAINATISIRHNVNRFNQSSVFPFLDLLKSENLQNSVSYYIALVHSWGNDAHLSALSLQEFANFQVAVLKKMKTMGFSVGWLPNRIKKNTCTATTKEDIIIDAYGNTHRCSEVPYVTTYGKYNTENDALTPFVSEHDALFDDWYNVVARKEYQCGTCNILPLCGGACPKAWHEGHVPCPPMKFNLPDLLLQQLMVDLKKQKENEQKLEAALS